jgi:ubiquinone/menaquinone biosynthesis C-methylase UbiE
MGEQQQRIVEQFTAQAESFVRAPHVNAADLVARFVAAVAPAGDERAIDIACGPGLLAKAFAPRVRELVGVDLTPAMVEKARAVAREAGLANARFEVADALALPFASGSVDLALTRLALHHMPDPGAALREAARVVRPGGRLGVFDIASSEDAAEEAYHNEVERLRDPSHARALPLSELVRAVGLAGFEVARVEALEFEIDVDEWIARADSSDADRRLCRARIAAALGSRKLGGKRVRQDAGSGKFYFLQSYAVIVATRF